MGSQRPRLVTHGLQVNVLNLPDDRYWHETVERLHRLTLLGLGDDVAGVRVELSGNGDIECRVSVRLRRSQRELNVETRHSDGALAVMQAFTRAQREAQRRLNAPRRVAQSQYFSDDEG